MPKHIKRKEIKPIRGFLRISCLDKQIIPFYYYLDKNQAQGVCLACKVIPAIIYPLPTKKIKE